MTEIALFLYDGMTALDAVGLQVLARLPDAQIKFVASTPGPKKTDVGLVLTADASLDQVPTPDIIRHPRLGQGAVLGGPRGGQWLRRAHRASKWTTSVCTGSMLLGAAGILQGKRATSHWAVRDYLRNFGAEPVAERVVIEGKVITAGGVSAGIDMALTLAAHQAGEDRGPGAQLVMKYDPSHPFDSGSLEKAEPGPSSAQPSPYTRCGVNMTNRSPNAVRSRIALRRLARRLRGVRAVRSLAGGGRDRRSGGVDAEKGLPASATSPRPRVSRPQRRCQMTVWLWRWCWGPAGRSSPMRSGPIEMYPLTAVPPVHGVGQPPDRDTVEWVGPGPRHYSLDDVDAGLAPGRRGRGRGRPERQEGAAHGWITRGSTGERTFWACATAGGCPGSHGPARWSPGHRALVGHQEA